MHRNMHTVSVHDTHWNIWIRNADTTTNDQNGEREESSEMWNISNEHIYMWQSWYHLIEISTKYRVPLFLQLCILGLQCYMREQSSNYGNIDDHGETDETISASLIRWRVCDYSSILRRAKIIPRMRAIVMAPLWSPPPTSRNRTGTLRSRGRKPVHLQCTPRRMPLSIRYKQVFLSMMDTHVHTPRTDVTVWTSWCITRTSLCYTWCGVFGDHNVYLFIRFLCVY